MANKNANLTNEEILEKVKERKYRRARGVARVRWLKNLGWWFFGVMSSFLVFVGVGAIFIGAVPIESLMNLATNKDDNSDIASEEILSSSILSAVMNINNYTIKDLPILKDAIMNFSPEYTEFDKDENFKPIEEGERIKKYYVCENGEYVRAFDDNGNYVAPATSTSQLYMRNEDSIGKKLFEYTPTTLDRSKDFFAKMYYYKNAQGNYARALDDQGNYVQGVNDSTQLYLVNLDDVSFKDATGIALTRLLDLEVTSVLKGAGFSGFVENLDENGKYKPTILTEILGNVKLGEMQSLNLTERINNVKLSFFVPYEENVVLYDVLTDIINYEKDESSKVVAQDITIGHLNGTLNFNAVKLSSILDPNIASNADLYDILVDAVNGKTNPAGTKTASKLTVEDLSGISVDNVKLVTVLPYNAETNDKLYDILLDVSHLEDINDITIKHISSFDTDNIHLTSIIDEPTAENGNKNLELYNILKDVVHTDDNKEITLGHLDNFLADDVRFVSILPRNSQNQKLYHVLEDALNKPYYEINVNCLNNFNVEDIHLSTVIENPTNVILKELLKDTADPVKIGNISAKIDELDFGTIYGVDCFKEYTSGTGARYNKVGDNYVLNANGDYQISKDAKMWLFLLYDVPSVDANGNATAYNKKSLKVSNISTSISNVSEVIKKSTIRQFIEAGILEDNGYDEVLLAMPIIDAIDKLNLLIKADNSK